MGKREEVWEEESKKDEENMAGVYRCSFQSHAVCVQVYILKDEGGRRTPFINNYSPDLFARTARVNTSMMLPEGQPLSLLIPPSSLSLFCYDRVVIGRGRDYTLYI